MKQMFYVTDRLADGMLIAISDQEEIVGAMEMVGDASGASHKVSSFEVSEECYAAMPKTDEWYQFTVKLGSGTLTKRMLWYTLYWDRHAGFSKDEFDNAMFRALPDRVRQELLAGVGVDVLMKF